ALAAVAVVGGHVKDGPAGQHRRRELPAVARAVGGVDEHALLGADEELGGVWHLRLLLAVSALTDSDDMMPLEPSGANPTIGYSGPCADIASRAPGRTSCESVGLALVV